MTTLGIEQYLEWYIQDVPKIVTNPEMFWQVLLALQKENHRLPPPEENPIQRLRRMKEKLRFSDSYWMGFPRILEKPRL